MQAAEQLGLYVMTSASILQGKLARDLPPALAQVLAGLRDGRAARAPVRALDARGGHRALRDEQPGPRRGERRDWCAVPPVPSEKLFSQA